MNVDILLDTILNVNIMKGFVRITDIEKRYFFLGLFLLFTTLMSAQKVALKTNAVYWASLTTNIGIELPVGGKFTTDWHFLFNPWTFSDNRKTKLMALQPELRYWFCEKFNGHFLGAHLVGGIYNIGNVDANFKLFGTDFGSLKDYRYEGWMAGIGLGYGYQWILSRHWSAEAEIGIGYIYTRADKFKCANCGRQIEKNKPHNYIGPTKAAISIIYAF